MRSVGLCLILLSGCGGDPETEAKCTSGAPSGLYRAEWTRQGGDCPDLPSSVVDATTASSLGPGCSVLHDERAWCTTERVVLCQSERLPTEVEYCQYATCTGSPTTKFSMHIVWRSDWLAATGTVGIEASGHDLSGANCIGVYGLRMTKL